MTDETKWEDPIVAEVRAIRDAHAKKFNYDIDAIFKDLIEKHHEYEAAGFKVAKLPIQRVEPKKTGTHE